MEKCEYRGTRRVGTDGGCTSAGVHMDGTASAQDTMNETERVEVMKWSEVEDAGSRKDGVGSPRRRWLVVAGFDISHALMRRNEDNSWWRPVPDNAPWCSYVPRRCMLLIDYVQRKRHRPFPLWSDQLNVIFWWRSTIGRPTCPYKFEERSPFPEEAGEDDGRIERRW
jgi:hypothetical protein